MRDLMTRAGKYFNLLCLFSAAIIFLDFTPIGEDVRTGQFLPLLRLESGAAAKTIVSDGFGSFKESSSLTLADSTRFNFLYDSLGLDSLDLSQEAYQKAIRGYLMMQMAGEIRNPAVLSIIDYSLPSSRKRLFVLDMLNGRLLFNTLVSHGRNSGQLMATRFSNRNNSYMSSIGFYITGDAYMGEHGYSLRLIGEEKGLNDNVYRRAIVMHPADYVSEEHIRETGYLGRSEGCPAIPNGLNKPIIGKIRGGSCLYVFGPDKKIVHKSRILS